MLASCDHVVDESRGSTHDSLRDSPDGFYMTDSQSKFLAHSTLVCGAYFSVDCVSCLEKLSHFFGHSACLDRGAISHISNVH